MKTFGIKIEGQERTLLYDPFSHLYFFRSFIQNERVHYYDTESLGLSEISLPMFLDYYMRSRQGHTRPPFINYLKITNRCNMQCSFCYAEANHHGDSIMDISSLKKLQGMLPSTSFLHTVISGGEPLLEFELVKKIQDIFKHVTLFTNGALLNDEIVKWAIATKSDMGISLDYNTDGFDCHESGPVRTLLQSLVEKYPLFKNHFFVSHVVRVKDIGKLDVLRAQEMMCEKEQVHTLNFPKEETGILSDDVINQEVDRVMSGSRAFQASIFTRTKWLFGRAKIAKFNCDGNCNPFISVNFNNDIYLCQTPSSKGSDEARVCNINDFTLEKYYAKIYEMKNDEPCGKDCYMKWTCGKICWFQNTPGSGNCERYKALLPYYLYLVIHKEGVNPDDFLSYHQHIDEECQFSQEQEEYAICKPTSKW